MRPRSRHWSHWARSRGPSRRCPRGSRARLYYETRVLGRGACAAVHLDPAHAGGLAVARRGRRAVAAAQAEGRRVAVRRGAGLRVRHARDLRHARRHLGGAPQAAHVGDAGGRRHRRGPLRHRGAAVVPPRAARLGSCPGAARGTRDVDAAVPGGRADRVLHPRQHGDHPGALSRLHRRRDARLHGARIPPDAATGPGRAVLAAGVLAAGRLRYGPVDAHHAA